MRQAILIVGILGVIGGVLFAQGTRLPVDSAAPDALLAEVRALRAEITQVAGASIRAQLLVAQLQLQEQRVVTVGRQLVDARGALASVQTRVSGERARVHQLEDAAARATDQGRRSMQQAIREAETHIEQQQGETLLWRARETELLKAVEDAQARWADLNNRLDALEQSMPAGASR
jgi:chromosome segregation ATPase